MRQASINNIQGTPVWNEVKNWNEEEGEVLTSQISKDLLRQVGEYALAESRAGRCVPHSRAMEMIKERMGWK